MPTNVFLLLIRSTHGGDEKTPADAAAMIMRKPESKEDYFKPEHIERTCKVCKIIANTNVNECFKLEENHDNKCCRAAFDKLRSKFDEAWEKIPSRQRRGKYQPMISVTL